MGWSTDERCRRPDEPGRGAGQAIRWHVWSDGDAEDDVEGKVDKLVFTTSGIRGYPLIIV
ncbi:protein of unknown function [Xenorhabdus nematophila AN6/1]|nr:protein of unknown function [Xenorhabdus nematophila AN6/1]